MNYNSLRVFNKVNQLCRNWRSQLYSLFVFGSSKYIYKGKNVHIYGFKTLSIGKACHIMDNSDIRGNVNIGNNVFIHENVLIRSMECSISIGNNTTVNRNTNILAQVTIGSNVSIAPNVVIVGMNHVFSNLDDTIKSHFDKYHYLCDTHTAVAVKVYDEYVKATGDDIPTVIDSTASPYKFSASVLNAVLAGKAPKLDEFAMVDELHKFTGADIPKPLASLKDKSIRFENMSQMVFKLLNL